jgi:predicted RND superfamily exporter protein
VYRLTRLSLSYPKATLLLIAAITVVFAGGLLRLRTEFGFRVLIGDDHPSIQALDQLLAEFGGGLPVQIAWECGEGRPCKSVFDPTSLEMAETVTRALGSSPGVRNVNGPNNAALLVPTASGFAVRQLVEDGKPVPDLETLQRRARSDPLWEGTFASADGTVGVIVVESSDTRGETDIAVVNAIEAALAPFEEQGFEFHLVGAATESVLGGRDLAESSTRLIPFNILVVGLILLAAVGSWQAAVTALGTMATALIWTLGLLGWLNWPQDGILEVLAPVIMVVGVCDAVHLLSRSAAEAQKRRVAGTQPSERSSILRAAQDVGPACLLTTATTAAAFASFATSTLDTFVRFGLITAFGVSVCLFLTFSMLPALAASAPLISGFMNRASGAWDSALHEMVRTSERRARTLFVASVALLIACGFGWAVFLRVDTAWDETYGEKNRIVRSIRFLEDRIRPADTLEIEIVLPREVAFESPSTLQKISEFSLFLSRIDGLGSVTSVLDFIERLNRLLHEDDPTFERPGISREANAEILELISLDDSGFVRSWLSLDRSRLRLSVQAAELSHREGGEVLETIERYVEETLPDDWMVVLSGELAITRDWITAIQGTQLRSFPTAALLVFVMVAAFLRSVRLVTLGAMGWIGMSLDVGRAMIAAVLIGIGVDDSIHLLSQYKARRLEGQRPREAMSAAVRHCGRAVVTTSVALSLGFLTLMASAWQSISSFGFFVSIAILAALGATLFVLPALVFVFDRED